MLILNFDVDPMDTVTGLPHLNPGEENDDEDSVFTLEHCDEPNRNDDNLTGRYEPEPTLPSMFLDVSSMYDSIKALIPPDERKPTVRKKPRGELSYTAIALTQLLKIINKNGGSKEMFDDVLEFIFEWTKAHKSIFHVKSGMPKWSRQRLVEVLEEEFDFHDMKSKQNDVKLHDGRVATIPVIDVGPQIRDLLDDEVVRNHISKGVCRDTFRLKVDATTHENDPKAILGEKHSGYLYQRAIDLHCPSGPNVDHRRIRPLLLIFHIDKTHADLFGTLSGIPVQCSLAMLDSEGQYNVRCWRVLAYIPNLSAGKGKDDKATNQSELNRQDFHKCLEVALSSLIQYYKEGGIWWIDEHGMDVLLKPIIHMIIGDTVGSNELINHFNSYLANCLAKDCRCTQSQIVKWPSKCRWPTSRELMACNSHFEVFQLYDSCNLISYQHLSYAGDDPEYAKSISKHIMKTAWDQLPLADVYLGIVGLTPQEFLHVMGCGLYKHNLLAIREIIGPNTSNARTKASINKAFSDIRFALRHNSERDVCPMSNRNGFFNVTSLTSEEVRGNFFGMVVLMHTNYGKELFKPCFDKAGIDFAEARTTCLLLLAWERFFYDPQTREDIELSFHATQILQKRIFNLIPREERQKDAERAGCRGWKITKFHLMNYIVGIVLKFGCMRNVDSGPNERHHKDLFKYHYGRTQKRPDKFSTQIADGEYERLLIDKATRHMTTFVPESIRNLLDKNKHKQTSLSLERQSFGTNVDNDDDKMYDNCNIVDNDTVQRGRYALTIALDDSRRRTVSHKWNYKYKNIPGKFLPNQMMGKILSDYHLQYCDQYSQPFQSILQYECFTSIKIDGQIFKSDSDWNGKDIEWMDWCAVRFPSTLAPTNRTVARGHERRTVGGKKCIARIMGFFRHLDVGVPTYKYVESRNLTWDNVTVQPLDRTIYAVLHCQSDWFQYSSLVNQFVYKFQVTELSEMFVLPVQCIIGPLLVVPDLISPNVTSKKFFMAILPRHKMGGYWKNYIKSEDPKFDFDETIEQSDSDSDDEPIHEVALEDELEDEEEDAGDEYEDGGELLDNDIEDY